LLEWMVHTNIGCAANATFRDASRSPIAAHSSLDSFCAKPSQVGNIDSETNFSSSDWLRRSAALGKREQRGAVHSTGEE
jgi:hypothetical protein